MELDSKSPARPDRNAVGPAPLRSEAGESGQQAQVHHHRGGHRAGRRRRRGHPGRAGLQRQVLLLPGFARGARTRIAAQGGINAAKNYHNDGDSIYRLFYDTVKGGDFRAREANVYRLAQISVNIIDQCVAQGVPFAREYGGLPGQPLLRRRAGFAHLLRARPDRPAAAARRLPGAGAADRRRARCAMFPRTEMLDLVVIDGRARGIVTRDLITGKIEIALRRRRGARHRRLRQRLSISPPTPRARNATAIWRAHKRGALFANPCFTQIHPTCIPVSGDYQSQAHPDERIAAQRRPHLGAAQEGRQAAARARFPKPSATTTWSATIPASATWCRATWPRRNAKAVCDEGRGVGESGLGVYLDFRDAIQRLGEHVINERYGNLFDMYERITGEDPYKVPMRIYPAIHYTMGGLWVDYNLMSTIPGLFVIGEANFSDHGANRLGASALMQGLADGYFVLPYTIGDYLASNKLEKVDAGARGGSRGRSAGRRCHVKRLLDDQGHAHGRFVPPRTGQADVGLLRHGAHGRGPEARAGADPRAARAVLERRARAGQRRGVEPVARKSRPRGRLLRARRADVPRRARAQRILRRPFPRRVSDAGRRGAARRRELLVRGGLGIPGRRASRPCCTRSR